MLQPKAIDCLRLAALKPGSKERCALLFDEMVPRWSQKALDVKMDELVRRGYVEALKSGTASGLLTLKGLAALQNSEGF